MSKYNFVLAVRNQAQAILWEELDGQISDGKWENARPMDHWVPWCDADVIVDPANVGVNFIARKDNYNFTDKMLLNIVGERMLESVRAQFPSYTRQHMMNDLNDLKKIIKTQRRNEALIAEMRKLEPKPEFGGLEVLYEAR